MSAPLTLAHPRPVQPPAASGDDPFEIGTLLGVLLREKLRVGLAGLVGLGAAVLWLTYFAVPTYVATTTVVLETRATQIVDLEGVISGLSGESVDLNTQVAVLKSHDLMLAVVDDLGLAAHPEFAPADDMASVWGGLRDRVLSRLDLPVSGSAPVDPRYRAAARLQDQTRIRNIPQSLVFEITVETRDPDLSVRIADQIAALYIQDQLAVKSDMTRQATVWLSDRVRALEGDLAQAEVAVKDFVAQTDLISVDALADLQRQAKELRQSILVTRTELDRVVARLTVLREPVSDLTAEIIAGLHEHALLQAFDGMRAGDRTARARFTARLDRLAIRAAADRDRLAEALTVLMASQATLEGRIAEQSTDLIHLEQLEREAEATRQQYAYFLNRFKETSVQEGIQRADARVLSAAILPTAPFSPRIGLAVAMGLAVGLAFGAVWGVAHDARQVGFKSAVQLEARTGLRVLGQVPKLRSSARKALVQTLKAKKTSAFGEAVRNLRTSVMSVKAGSQPKVILVSSSVPGEGKTTQAVSLAHNLRALGKSVLLIEGDVRRRVFDHYFKAPEGVGILAAMSDPDHPQRAIFQDEGLAIDVLGGDSGLRNAADIFESRRFAQLIKVLRGQYDHIVIDSPPVLAVTDARILGRHADAILYVVRWDATSGSQVSEGVAQFHSVGLSVDGLILSQIDGRAMKRSGYGSYYGFGAEGYYAQSA